MTAEDAQAAVTPRIGRDVRLGEGVRVEAGAVIGDGATVGAGVRIGVDAVVRAGSVVVEDVPALAVVGGDPARVVSYVNTAVVDVPESADATGIGSELVRLLPEVNEERGCVVILEHGAGLPFTARRCLLVHGVPPGGHRGDHAHRTLEEIVVCAAGSCTVLVDDGRGRREVVVLDRPGVGVVIPPYVWTAQFGHSADAVLVVLSSAEYDPSDYITDYGTFRAEVAAR